MQTPLRTNSIEQERFMTASYQTYELMLCGIYIMWLDLQGTNMINNLFYLNFVKYINDNKCILMVHCPSCLGLVCEEEIYFINIIYVL